MGDMTEYAPAKMSENLGMSKLTSPIFKTMHIVKNTQRIKMPPFGMKIC